MEQDRPLDIREIEAEGVLGEFKYTVGFDSDADKDRMRVIYAPNGRGKTNFLRAVNLLLTPSPDSFDALIEVPVRLMRITFVGGGQIELTRKQVAGSFSLSAAATADGMPAKLKVDPSELPARYLRRVWDERHDFTAYGETVNSLTSGAVFIGDDRLLPAADEQARPERRRRSQGSVSRLLEAVERMLTQTALASLSRESAQTGVYGEITRTTLEGSDPLTATAARRELEQQIERLLDAGSSLETYGLLSMRQVRDISVQLASTRANNRRLPTVHRVLKPYLDSLEDQVRTLDPVQELIDTFVTAVNQFLDRKTLEFSAGSGIRMIGRRGERLHPENLSSGERHLLLLLSQAILATVERPLVIIDEPEISLGLEWQRDLIPALLRCTAAARVQFVVASHSTQVMGAVPRDEIIVPGEGD